MINDNKALTELLDRYVNGTLSYEEQERLENNMNNDDAFKTEVETHLLFLTTLKRHGKREILRTFLNDIHSEEQVYDQSTEPVLTKPSISRVKKYWPSLAVAASVALVSVLGTLLITKSFERKQAAYYKELRRNVEQIKNSQRAIIAGIAEKEKEDPFPGNYTGTGFLISSGGYLATSYHVVKDADSIYVENEKFGSRKATIIKIDEINDLALLKIEIPPIKKLMPYVIKPNEADLGEDVYTLGFPREDIVYGSGTVSASTGYREHSNSYQIAVPVNPGNSGGPLLNHDGDVIGVISGMQTETSGAAFAIKSPVLLEMIQKISADSLIQPIQLPRQNRLRNVTRTHQIKKMREFIFIVKVYNSK
jgi:serine protease Do